MIAFTPFKGNKERVLSLLHALFRAGIIAFTTGDDPLRIRFLVPAGGITLDQIDHIAALLEEELIGFK